MTGFLLIALILPSALVQAAPAAITLTEKDSGRTLTLKVGETLVLNLRNPGSGGYNVLPPVYDGEILALLSRKDIPPEKRPQPLMGDFGRIEFTWEARQPGTTEVTVNIARPWEKTKPPEQFMKIRVRVEN
ncbi:MAG: protease inhibitor I42 family protein [Deltaproteobacteria bacterium]|nr:protease inhibitor I42 family protein [Deltaproteobacteria bacterium]